MRKYDMRTRQGRARRRAGGQFNPHTCLPHTAGSYERERTAERRRLSLLDRIRRWAAILGGKERACA